MTAVEMTIEPRTRTVGTGTVERLLPFRKRRMVGPFIFVDHMGPEALAPGARVDVDAHPHLGLSTLTYLLAGRLVHRDSTGAVATIRPGDVNWMTAGAGVCHTERSDDTDVGHPRDHHGLQMWVALPDDTEDGPARFEHHPADALPQTSIAGATVTVAAGTGWGVRAPVEVSSPLVLADVRLEGGRLPLDATHPELAVLALDGDVALDDTHLVPGGLAVLTAGSRPVLSGTGRAVVIGGEPVGPRHIWWNFVHSDPERIEAAKDDWAHQRFPLVPGDHDPWVPLP